MAEGTDAGRYLRLRRGLVQFLAIFLGVSLSFVAEDWREDRGDRREVRRVLERVAQDIEIDIPQLETLIALDSTGAAAGWWLHENWDRADLPVDSVTDVLDQLHLGGPYAPVRAQYESAKTSGLLALVEPEALQNAIITLYEMQQPFVGKVGELRQEIAFDLWRVLRPHQVYTTKLEPGPVPSVDLATPWPDVRSDKTLRSAIVEAAGFRRLNSERLSWYLASAVEVRDMIENQLAGR